MNYKKCTILACIMLLAACGPDDDKPADSNPSMLEPWQNNTPLPVKLTPGEASTRAADGLMNGNLPSGTSITVVIDGKEYTYQTNDAQTEMTCITTPAPYYPINGQSISIKAYYPTIASGGWYSSTNTWSWCVDKDQSSDTGYRNSDRMYATVSSGYNGLDANGKVKPTSNAVPLTFNHLMAKVVLTITQPDDGTKIKEVALGSVKTGYGMDCVNNRAYNAFFWNTNPSGTITLYNNADGATGTVTCAGVFPPQTIGTDVDFITVTTTENTIFYKLPQSVNFAAGQQHQFKLSSYVDKSGYVVGNVICSDGSMIPYKNIGTRTPVAIIVYVGPNTGNANYKHGLAIALKDSGSNYWKNSSSTTINHTIKWAAFSSGTTYKYVKIPANDVPVEDGSIYMDSQHLKIVSGLRAFPAFYYAKNCGYAEPPKTSGWFLPSAYQWQQAYVALGTELFSIMSSKGIPEKVGYDISNTSMYWSCTQTNSYQAKAYRDNTFIDCSQAADNLIVRAMLAF